MTHPRSNWFINQRSDTPLPVRSVNHAMAWARDSLTLEPVYILELDKTRRGAKSGCECPSCNLPLQAVNAAKTEYKKRPHFRHPNGAPKAECMYLSARLAAIQMLRESGAIQLPRRTIRGEVVGLSGSVHEAWVERPPQKLAIRNFNFCDRAAAILTFEDGRQLQVLLTGTGSTTAFQAANDCQVPTIWLDLPDTFLASMSPEDLKTRLTLLPDGLCWVSHWEDETLRAEAQSKASEIAARFMDLTGDYSLELEGVEQKFRRETVLHLEVKRILAESKEIAVPALRVRVDDFAENGFGFEREWSRPVETLALLDVRLEQKMGQVIPDVLAQVREDRGGRMIFEVTVTNRIGADRLARIGKLHIPALEIDLSRTGGLLTRAELRQLVVYGLETKRWLHHPELDYQTTLLTNEVAAAILKIESQRIMEDEYRRTILKTPISVIANDYLELIFRYAELDRERHNADEQKNEKALCLEAIYAKANDLAIHGFNFAGAPELFSERRGIIPRILSIKIGRGVGYKLDTTMAVMNAIRQSQAQNRSNHSIYLIAEKVYRSALQPIADWYADWVNEVRAHIESYDQNYIRDDKHDKLLILLFPEMAKGIKTGFGTRSWRKVKTPTSKNSLVTSPSYFRNSKPGLGTCATIQN